MLTCKLIKRKIKLIFTSLEIKSYGVNKRKTTNVVNISKLNITISNYHHYYISIRNNKIQKRKKN